MTTYPQMGSQTLVIEPEAVILNRIQGQGICTPSNHPAHHQCQSVKALDGHDLAYDAVDCRGLSQFVAPSLNLLCSKAQVLDTVT